ncbi:hypothetical protein LCGC14_3077880, partial [marine sediment metagenome]
MSLTYASRRVRPLFWCAAIVLSGALHAGLPVLLLDHDAFDKRAEPQAEGITGAMMFDLSDIIAAPSALQEDSVAQVETQEAPTVTESPEVLEAAKAAEQPIL